jgi:hypothetical protein
MRGIATMSEGMSKKFVLRSGFVAGAAMALLLVFFEVTINPQFALPRTVRQPDAAQETRYAVCFGQRDRALHERAFATIDNPDVQREFISTERAKASDACRDAYPERLVSKQLPFRFNLLDLRYRYQ